MIKIKSIWGTLLAGLLIPAVIWAVPTAADIALNEEGAVIFPLMIIEGLLFLALPVYMIKAENKAAEQVSPKKFIAAYLGGFAAVTALLLPVMYLLSDRFFSGSPVFMAGIGLALIWLILAAGFCWAVMFRAGELLYRRIIKK